jgi:solute carrier family 8 (sodium/calcium exchanger)
MEQMNILTISTNTFFQHQKYYLHPSVCSVWEAFQDKYFQRMKEQNHPLVLGGDGRADTPGHSAKYGSYAMLDMDLVLVIHVELVQVCIAYYF